MFLALPPRWPNGPSEMCANQLAQLTSAMARRPVNLKLKGEWGEVRCRGARASVPTAKGEGWCWSDERMTEQASERREDVIDVGARWSGRVN